MITTRCRVCGCKLKSGDLCRRCEYEQDWRNTPEYFCTSSNCQKLLPGATEPGLCDACKKLAQIPYKPLKKPIKIEEKPETKPEIQEEIAVEKTEKCNDCKTPITARRKSQSGLCERCFGRQWARKRAQAKADAKTTPAPAPKTGAKKAEPITETAAATIHASQPPKVEKTEELPPPATDLPVSLRELQRLAHENAIKKGWHETPRSDGEMIALMHSELSEALEELRDGKLPGAIYHSDHNGFKPEGVPIELADVVIRIMDFCGLHGIDLQHAIVTKMVYNQTRPHRHGGKKL